MYRSQGYIESCIMAQGIELEFYLVEALEARSFSILTTWIDRGGAYYDIDICYF